MLILLKFNRNIKLWIDDSRICSVWLPIFQVACRLSAATGYLKNRNTNVLPYK
ncbi:hypothetical protein HMPREF9371_2256 [Neisseria shayeganii 871]|uniref:Uncharacterized protein n=1 Tax=Neisseria shayeganii 871 TaxID=1032488 RepID=G4CKW5_9NEIS|nr:hypothetical protein HMPREF9371_2256 [Neisseria shayeganii 871]